MADPIAEAFVGIRPDFSGFQSQLQAGVNNAFKNLKVPPATQQNLAGQMFGPGFSAAAKTSTTNAVSNVKISQQVPRTLAQQLFGSAFRTESGRAFQGALSGLGLGNLAAQSAFFGPGGAAIAVAAAGFAAATVSAAQFERTLDVLQATTGATDDQIAQLSDRARQLGADVRLPAVTAQSAAEAMTELSKAGLSIQDTFDGVEGVLQLSTAAQISAGEAASITASALNAFNLAGTEAVHVADLLAGASIAAQGDIHDMALALQQSSAVADQAGLSVEQLVGFITLLAKQGILGSDAGTSIRTSLLRLVPTTKKARDVMESLGIQLDRTRTLGAQLPELLDQFKVAADALNPTLRQQLFTEIAGTDAIRALTTAVEAGGDGFRQSAIEVDRANAAQRLAEAQTKGLAGSVQGLTSSVQTLGLSIGQSISPVAQAFVDMANDIVSGINDANSALEDFEHDATEFLKPVSDAFDKASEAAGKFLRSGPGGNAIADFFGGGADLQSVQEDIRKTGAFLDFALTKAIDTRAELLKLGLPTDKIDAQIEQLKAQLRSLREETGSDIGLDLADPIDRAIASAEDLRDALIAQGAPKAEIAAVNQQIAFLSNNLAIAAAQAEIAAQKRGAAIRQLSRALGIDATELSRLKTVVSREGNIAGREFGRKYIDGVATQITADEAEAIAAARTTLANITREGEEQVIAAIRSAQSNLDSIGDQLASSLEQAIDLGPIGQRLTELKKQLEDLQDTVSKRRLRFDLRDAQRDLKDAKEAIAQVGVLTPAEKRRQQEFLDPFREKVGDAKAALKEFDLNDAIADQEKLEARAKKTAEDGLENLITKFKLGKISADEFSKLLNQQLAPSLDLIDRKNLGLSFETGFLGQVHDLVAQVKALSPFIGTPGTTGAIVVKPAETQAQVNQRISESEAHLRQIQKDAVKKSDQEQEKLQTQIGLLKQLVRLLGGDGRGAHGGPGGARG